MASRTSSVPCEVAGNRSFLGCGRSRIRGAERETCSPLPPASDKGIYDNLGRRWRGSILGLLIFVVDNVLGLRTPVLVSFVTACLIDTKGVRYAVHLLPRHAPRALLLPQNGSVTTDHARTPAHKLRG